VLTRWSVLLFVWFVFPGCKHSATGDTDGGVPDLCSGTGCDQPADLACTGPACSICAHDCQGGACAGGECQPVEVAPRRMLQRQLARGESLEPERLATKLAYIFRAATRMRGMTQELLDASVQQSGVPLALLPAKTELVALTRQAVREHQMVSDLHQFLFEAQTPSVVVSVDETRAHRVLANLLTNAIKYSPDGGPITLVVRLAAPATAVLAVHDQGQGIPADDLPHIFERFHRAANVGRIAGSGLGLWGARRIVEQHGGRIVVESVLGQGTTVTVALPCERCAPCALPAAP